MATTYLSVEFEFCFTGPSGIDGELSWLVHNAANGFQARAESFYLEQRKEA